ncbi:MAG: cyanophycinase [Planctomycetota bacterium]|jgi:cyanophycinase
MISNRALFHSVALGLLLTGALLAIDHSSIEAAPGGGGGVVLAIGGGTTPRPAIREALRLAGSDHPEKVTVVVLAYASSLDDRGEGSAAMWIEEGATSARVAPDDAAEAATLIAGADVIWMGGGSQNRLLDDLERMELVDDIQGAHARGALVGGTSAGAAVLGSHCIAGSPEPEAYVVGAMKAREGLGLLADTIVDQHFRERKREGRLLTAVLDAGGVRGFGVSESTALFFNGEDVRLIGEGVVVVFDASLVDLDESDAGPKAGALRSANGIVTKILSPKRDAVRAR